MPDESLTQCMGLRSYIGLMPLTELKRHFTNCVECSNEIEEEFEVYNTSIAKPDILYAYIPLGIESKDKFLEAWHLSTSRFEELTEAVKGTIRNKLVTNTGLGLLQECLEACFNMMFLAHSGIENFREIHYSQISHRFHRLKEYLGDEAFNQLISGCPQEDVLLNGRVFEELRKLLQLSPKPPES
jgi:hypothetical protein